MSSKELREEAYQQAIIQLSKELPTLISAMDNLASQIRNMPNSMRLHY